MKVLETAVGAVCAPTRFSLVRISVRNLARDGKSLLRSSGVGGGGEDLNLENPMQFAVGHRNAQRIQDIYQERKGHINLRKCPGHRPGVPGTPGGTNGGLPAGVPGISC